MSEWTKESDERLSELKRQVADLEAMRNTHVSYLQLHFARLVDKTIPSHELSLRGVVQWMVQNRERITAIYNGEVK